MTASSVTTEEVQPCFTYGVMGIADGRIAVAVRDVCLQPEALNQLIQLMNDHQLAPEHCMDVLDNFCQNDYCLTSEQTL